MVINKSIWLALVAAGTLTVAGCQNNPAQQNGAAAQSKFQMTEKVFNGVVPCADCSGIETTLRLGNDGTYILREVYLKTGYENEPFVETGRWAAKDQKITLTSKEGNKSYFQMKGDDLDMLDTEGQPIQSELNYKLEKVKPTQLAGEYRYFADSAVFTECRSGKRYDAAENLDMERGYRATGVKDGEPVYVEVEGYYTLRPSMEDGLFDNALIQSGKAQFDKSSSCQTKK